MGYLLETLTINKTALKWIITLHNKFNKPIITVFDFKIVAKEYVTVG